MTKKNLRDYKKIAGLKTIFNSFGKNSFFRKISKEGLNLPNSGNLKNSALGKKSFFSKIFKEGVNLQNSVKLKNNSTHLAKIRFTVNSLKKVSFSHIQ
jgi:hypothetical protein